MGVGNLAKQLLCRQLEAARQEEHIFYFHGSKAFQCFYGFIECYTCSNCISLSTSLMD